MPIYNYDFGDGPIDKNDNFDGAGRVQTHRRRLITDDPTMDEYLASAKFSDVLGIVKGTPHPTCNYSFCKSINTKEETKSKVPQKLFWFDIAYTTSPDTGGGGAGGAGGFSPASGPAAGQVAQQQQGLPPPERIDNPLLRPWDFSSDCEMVEVARLCDRNGKAYVNTLGDVLLPAMKTKVPCVKYSLGKNFAYPKEFQYIFVGAVNNLAITLPGSLTLWGVETLKLNHLQISRIYESGLSYYRHNYTILTGPYWKWDFSEYLGWVLEVPNTGKRAKDAGSGKFFLVVDDAGRTTGECKFLDENGYQLGYGVDPTEIFWLRFHPDRLFPMVSLFL